MTEYEAAELILKHVHRGTTPTPADLKALGRATMMVRDVRVSPNDVASLAALSQTAT